MSEPKRYAILGVVVEPSYNAEEVTSEMIAVPLGAWVRHDDYARLKAEVERLTKENALATPRHLIASQDIKSLKEEVERLTKAGDAMAKLLSCCGNPQSEVRGWNAAKGVQS